MKKYPALFILYKPILLILGFYFINLNCFAQHLKVTDFSQIVNLQNPTDMNYLLQKEYKLLWDSSRNETEGDHVRYQMTYLDQQEKVTVSFSSSADLGRNLKIIYELSSLKSYQQFIALIKKSPAYRYQSACHCYLSKTSSYSGGQFQLLGKLISGQNTFYRIDYSEFEGKELSAPQLKKHQ